VASMLAVHTALGTWGGAIDCYIALTDFARNKFVHGGLPAKRIAGKPNFVHPDPGAGDGRGGYALFVGRVTAEKGVPTLLKAWQSLGSRLTLKVVGDGPFAEELERSPLIGGGVEWLGRRSRDEVIQLMRDASFLVFP